ncbi:DUF309 domain-containing protein [Bacillus sp. FJAT-49732]|uniref:DUF309 domain-containing protein n=1 Tax=Lederbergia citrisecunda TaxID=2833583 RepID=A0A942TP66_9BACI|nr:DUF309 domain-containing protein [Lederbergia citrisecunda]MBS4199552.1 DUF309 domain-containing protein [Lederbergia citrisecunda]
MSFSEAYIAFLIHFHADRDYFECHEVLEEHWKKNGMTRDSIWVGFIQVAVSYYHYRRGNVKGSLKMMDKALHLLSYKKDEVLALGVDYDLLIRRLNKSRAKMIDHKPYEAINIPIENQLLLAICKNHYAAKGYEWGNLFDEAPEYIVHKHTLRDRSKVVPNRKYVLV